VRCTHQYTVIEPGGAQQVTVVFGVVSAELFGVGYVLSFCFFVFECTYQYAGVESGGAQQVSVVFVVKLDCCT
jgi:hypothetical protein